MKTSRWLNWSPVERILLESARSEPTKPTDPAFEGFVGPPLPEERETPPLRSVLRNRVVELYLTNGDRLFMVADEDDAAKLGEPRGSIYTAAEVRLVIQIADPGIIAEVHRWKRQFEATVRREAERHSGSDSASASWR